MKKYLMIFLIMLIALSFAAANASDLSDVQKSGKLRLGVPPEYIPFIFYDETGNTTGLDVALMQEIARRMGVQLQVYNLAFDGIIDSLDLGQVDVIGGAISKTAEREQAIDFTRVYYSGDAQFIAKNTLAKPAAVDLNSFRNYKLGVQKGTSFDQWVKTNLVSAGYVSPRDVFTYSSASDEMKALDRGDVDFAILDQDVYEDLFKSTGNYQIFYDGFMQENYAFGMRKNSDLTAVVNGHLTDMIKDGTAQSIANRFFQMDFGEAKSNNSRSSSVTTPTPITPVYVIPTQPAANCKNGMTFVSDVTITDGHQVSRGERFTKVWRVRNTGTCTWTPNYTFVFVSGDQMSGRNISIPATVQPNQMIDLSVNLIAPNSDGTYRGYWQMRSPQGQNFGESIWVKIRVNGGGSSGNKPVINQFYPNFYSSNSGTCPTVYWNTSNAAMIEIKVDGGSVIKSYTVNGSQQICGALQGIGNHTVELAAMSSTDTVYKSFTYTTTRGEDGQKQIIPVINYFYISPDSGYMGDSTTAYWSVSNAGAVDVYVDGNLLQRSSDATGSASISATIQNVGTHTISLTAHSVTDDTTSTVYYTMKEEEGQKQVIPVVNSFYASPDSGYMGDSTNVYWSVSNASSIVIDVDGSVIYNGSDSDGSAPVSAVIQSVGTHTITLLARSVTDDTYAYAYYMMNDNSSGGDDGQQQVIPSIDYFYVDPSSGTMGDSTTAYWSVSNAASVDIDVDGNQIVSNGGTNGSAPISAVIQSVGTHSITLTAHSVTDDASQTVYYDMSDNAPEPDPEFDGGWAGMNYEQDNNILFQNGWTDSSEQGQGGWAGAGYVEDEVENG